MNGGAWTLCANTLLTMLGRSTYQGAIAIGALYALCRWLEARYPPSANLRCWLWRLGYLKLLLGLTSLTGFTFAVLPVSTAISASSPNAGTVDIVRAQSHTPHTATANAPAFFERERPVRGAEEAEHSVVAAASSYPLWVAALYLLGLGICLGRVVRAGVRTRYILREATLCADDALNEEAERLARLLKLRRVPPLAYSPLVTGPCCAAGTVLLPAVAANATDAAGLAGYAPDEHPLILAHELAHIRRNDLGWEWLGTLTQVVFFFHPLIYLMRREERLSRESAADAAALRVTASPASAYATLLVGISQTCARRQQFHFFTRLTASENALAGVVGVMERGVLLRRRLLYLKENNLMSAAAYPRLLSVVLPVLLVSAVVFVPWHVTAVARAAGVPPKSADVDPSATSAEADAASSRDRQIDMQALKEYKRFWHPSANDLRLKAYTALAYGKPKEAIRYATLLLNSDTHPTAWDGEYGNIVYTANHIKGLAALQEGRIDDAKLFLIAAGQTPGSPTLDSFGPCMLLAQRLLDRGEKDVVIQYLDLVARFWAHTPVRWPTPTSASERRYYSNKQHSINEWKRQIAAGKKPLLNYGHLYLY